MTRPMSWTCSTKSPRYLTILRTFQAWECLSTRSDLGHRCSSPHSGGSWAADPYSPEMPVTFWPWLAIADSLTLAVLAEVAVALGPTAESSASESADCLVVDLLVVEAPSCFSHYQSCSNWSSSAAGILFVVAGSQNSSSATMQRYFGLLYLRRIVSAQAHSLFYSYAKVLKWLRHTYTQVGSMYRYLVIYIYIYIYIIFKYDIYIYTSS